MAEGNLGQRLLAKQSKTGDLDIIGSLFGRLERVTGDEYGRRSRIYGTQ